MTLRKSCPRISKEMKIKVIEMLKAGLTQAKIAKAIGRSIGTVNAIRKTIKVEKEPSHPKPEFDPMKRKLSTTNPITFLRQAVDRVGLKSKDEDYAKIAIQTNKPIAVMKAADFHFGGLDVSYDALLTHIEFLLKVDNFYLQLFGDDLNLMIMHRTVSARHDGWTPAEQIEWLQGLVDVCMLKGKLLSMCWGNHTDEFTERVAGFGIVRMLMKYKVPYFRGLGYIDLKVGKHVYPMAFTHKVRFNSFMNSLHGNKRLQQLHTEFFTSNRPIAKEYITAHTHNPAISVEGCLPEERIWYIKCGTFKTNCLYSQRYFGQGRIGIPTVVYHPDRFEHVCFPTPWEAYRYMNGKDWEG